MSEELDFAEAFNRLELWVSLRHADVLTDLDDQAAEMMAFAAGVLDYECPAVLPQIRLDTDGRPWPVHQGYQGCRAQPLERQHV